MQTKSEPVAWHAALQTLLIAIFAAAKAFNWWNWTDGQEAVVLGLYGALIVVIGSLFTRSKVAPVPPPHPEP